MCVCVWGGGSEEGEFVHAGGGGGSEEGEVDLNSKLILRGGSPDRYGPAYILKIGSCHK